MLYCCSQCDFTSSFESALTMHHQLYHETLKDPGEENHTLSSNSLVKSTTLPRTSQDCKLTRTSSATKLFNSFKTKICKARLNPFVHPEESTSKFNKVDSLLVSERTSKAAVETVSAQLEVKESFGCHLCPFEADRITVLDRHLLNDHQIGLENLLKLVLAKTKHGLSDTPEQFGFHQPYYKAQDEIFENGEFILENVTPQIKILKHTGVNTDLHFKDIPDVPELKGQCKVVSQELEEMLTCDANKLISEELLQKMQDLNKYMCKFAESSNALKKVLNKQSTPRVRDNVSNFEEPMFDLGLGDQSPRDFEKALSENMQRSRQNNVFKNPYTFL